MRIQWQTHPAATIRGVLNRHAKVCVGEVTRSEGRASLKKEMVNSAEIENARATYDALNWLAKEGRPDLVSASSLISSRLASLTIEDVCNLNTVVKQAK